MNNNINYFTPKIRKKILFSSSFREMLIMQDTSIVEQRIIATILTSLKDAQSKFINKKSEFIDKIPKQLSFEDYYDGWAHQGLVEFLIPFKQVNPNGRMKNSVIQESLINMSNLSWFRLRDETIDGYQLVPFLKDPAWNKKNIYFKMDKEVLRNLLDIKPYYPVISDIVYKTSVSNTLRFLLWLMLFRKKGWIKKIYNDLLTELNIPTSKYEGFYRFERDFLKRVKADLDGISDLSFNYNYIKETEEITISLYYTKNAIGNSNFPDRDSLQIARALKYLEIRRKLSPSQLRIIHQLYTVRGYDAFAKKIKRKINPKLTGEEYIKEVFKFLNEYG